MIAIGTNRVAPENRFALPAVVPFYFKAVHEGRYKIWLHMDVQSREYSLRHRKS